MTIAGAAIGVIQIAKRSLLGGVDALDELSRRRPLKRFKELLEATDADSAVRALLQAERDAELFRQVFGKAVSLEIQRSVIALRMGGRYSTRELRHLLRYMPYDAPDPADPTARASAVWNLRAAAVQALLVAVVIAMTVTGALVSRDWSQLRFFVAVLVVAVPGFFMFVREGVHGHLARQAIDRVRRDRACTPATGPARPIEALDAVAASDA